MTQLTIRPTKLGAIANAMTVRNWLGQSVLKVQYAVLRARYPWPRKDPDTQVWDFEGITEWMSPRQGANYEKQLGELLLAGVASGLKKSSLSHRQLLQALGYNLKDIEEELLKVEQAKKGTRDD